MMPIYGCCSAGRGRCHGNSSCAAQPVAWMLLEAKDGQIASRHCINMYIMYIYIYISMGYYTYTWTCMISIYIYMLYYIYIALRVTRNETGAASESLNTDLHMPHGWPPSSLCQRVCALCGGCLQRGIVGGWSSLLV